MSVLRSHEPNKNMLIKYARLYVYCCSCVDPRLAENKIFIYLLYCQLHFLQVDNGPILIILPQNLHFGPE